jgi:hypothetical protein
MAPSVSAFEAAVVFVPMSSREMAHVLQQLVAAIVEAF